MNIKNLKPNFNAATNQGYFNVNESVKYIGKEKKVIYRSSWEKRFCIWCESSPTILQWACETIEIKYFCPVNQKQRNYYPDFLIKTSDNKVLIVEVKPKKDYLILPVVPKRKTDKSITNFINAKKTIAINLAKFSSAKEYCKIRGWEFLVVNEDWFKLKK